MQPADISPQQRRENPDPHEQANPVPRLVLALLVLLIAFGIGYIATSDVDTPAAWGDGRQPLELAGTRKAAAATGANGAALYASLCVACHQASGQGLPGVFPPLAGSEWVNGQPGTAAAIVLHGVTGPIQVKGQTYNGAMPTFGQQLGDAEIAALLTHLRTQWGNAAPAVSAETVAKARADHKDRTTPFAGEKELPSHE